MHLIVPYKPIQDMPRALHSPRAPSTAHDSTPPSKLQLPPTAKEYPNVHTTQVWWYSTLYEGLLVFYSNLPGTASQLATQGSCFADVFQQLRRKYCKPPNFCDAECSRFPNLDRCDVTVSKLLSQFGMHIQFLQSQKRRGCRAVLYTPK